MKKEYIDVTGYSGEGYKPLVDFESWRIAILNYIDELEIQRLRSMQKHNETDEVFVLLSGNCTLFTGGLGDSITEIDAIAMEPYKLYNVKKGVWHTHTLDKKAMVLIVENQNTSELNSPKIRLNEEQITMLQQVFQKTSPSFNYLD
ncbi:MAG: hypothetical protein K0S76_1703 [Herbinix sp.]|jgi:hypothetical protein|nr:hypothetical protein [Herbinix sp.]